ncbi:hypothetical protein N780_16530 [Pontibacillus chungwhensis BH030062]|uniref:Competence protein ComG n=1 Tax=Pontibacillus chungwhensis BH030062 TaxID=1385513 RepID=A0A0A2UUP3_9BACI|nr:hypothetical protein [Pontibacillus chungwhensis]KGP92017.1 hypothetical protein N780_16530 [Pontibacillus chungwhensis BH030062]
MLQNNKGFALLDALYSLSLMLVITLSLFPILQIVFAKQYELETRRKMAVHLHNELIQLEENLPDQEIIGVTVNGIHGSLHVETEQNQVKGCLTWKLNEKGGDEYICFYVPPKGK